MGHLFLTMLIVEHLHNVSVNILIDDIILSNVVGDCVFMTSYGQLKFLLAWVQLRMPSLALSRLF